MCVAPCTANTLAKLAWGLADNVVTQSALSTPAPLLVAPAMNVRMWHHPATQDNVATLRRRGVAFVGPAAGALAEGEQGMGRMSEPAEIVAAIEALLGRGTGRLAGRRVLVTAGGTREPLDSVRFLGNRSSGRMGAALAAEASARGADVVTLLANGSVRPESGAVVEVETAEELEREALARAGWADIVLMAAAVADYRPTQLEGGKHRRGGPWSLELEPTADVLAGLAARRRPGQVLVGFAAEDGADVESAQAKRLRKGVDLIVLNDVSRGDIGFDADHNEVVLVSSDSAITVARAPKRVIAAAVLDRVEQLLSEA
jgi:phosphopantothenoylcysteine decarboxylase/phosphopantothenate--cysteine ligase